MEPPYTVALQAADALPVSQRMAAEVRFAAALEDALGDAAAVAQTLRAWHVVSESAADQIDTSTAARAVHWPRAYERATRAGLAVLGPVRQASFEVTLVRGG
jgi:hypothetical protein